MRTVFTGILAVLMLLSLPVSFHAQGIRQSIGLVKEKKDKTTKNDEVAGKAEVSSLQPEKDVFSGQYRNDTVYCIRTRKQYGWFAPLDTISKESMLHQNAVYRFTHRYPSGHWGKMETVDSQGNLVAGYMSPYILKTASADSDSKANADWVSKLQTSCVYEFIADPSGEKIIQERAYDESGNIVYVYSRVPFGDEGRQYIGSYKDCYGLPAEMRKDSLFTYGTLVRLTEDQWGNDSIVEYIDAKGKPKLNSDSVAMEVFICDRYGRMLKQQSRDEHGNLTIDNWGNCGNEYVWNDDHEVISATHMDDNWQPMRMPDRREIENGVGVIKTVYGYDSWKRQVEEAYYTEDDVPDCNLYGIHRITYEYDDRGRALRTARFDFDGNLKEDSFGTAVVEYTYDNDGRNIGIVFLDKDRKPCSKPGYLSKVLYAYDDAGNMIQEKRYVVYSGKETLDYEYKEGKNYKYIRWSDNVMRIDSLDVEGRLVKCVYTDWNGNLSDESVGYAINEITYVPRPYGNDITDCYYDKNKEICAPENVWAVREVKSDTISRRNNVRLYDKEKRLIATYAEIYDKNGSLIGEDDTNAFGITSRAGGVSSVRHYRALIGYSTNRNTFSTLIGRDEFGEPDYISSPWGIYYYMKLSAQGNNLSMDESSRVIIDQEKFKNECPKLMTIEVTDSMAYKLGLRDNDVVLLDGDYAVDVFALDSVLVSCNDFVRNWTVHSVLDGNRNRSMVVFRVDPETLEYGLVKIDHLKGSPSELGYLAHIRYLTRKQLKRIQACIMDNMESDNPLVRKSDLAGMDYSGDNMVIMAFTDMYRDVRHYPYAREVTDPSILLGACMNVGNMTWKFGESSGDDFKKILTTRQMRALAYPVQHFYLTRNGKDIIDLKNDEENVRTNWMDVYVSDEVYRKLAALSGKAEAMLESEMTDVPRLDKKDLADNWVLKLSRSGYEPYVQVSLLKDGTMKGFIEQYDSIEYNEGNALFRIRQNLDGRWADCGSMLEFTYQDENTVSLECIGLSGIDPLHETRSLAFVNKNAGKNPQYYLNRMNVRILGRFAYVKDLSKDRLVIDDGTAEGLTLYRLSRRRLKDSSGKDGQQESVSDTGSNEIVELDEDSKKLLGTWMCRIDGTMNAACTLHFTENGKVHLDIDVTNRQKTNDNIWIILSMNMIMEETWNLTGNFLKLRSDPAAFDVKFDVDLEGVEGRQKEEMLAVIRQAVETEKQNMVMNLLWQFTSDGEAELENMTDTSFVLNGMEFTRTDVPEAGLEELVADKVVVVGRIEDPDGMLMKDGYKGEYIVLKWCDWNYTMTLDEFTKEFEKKKDKEKDIVLLPVELWGKPNRYGKKILVLHYPPGMLGIRLMDFHVSYKEYVNELRTAYDKYQSGTY